MEKGNSRAAVIGAGYVGLATAVVLAEGATMLCSSSETLTGWQRWPTAGYRSTGRGCPKCVLMTDDAASLSALVCIR
jgi:glycine/D-amino acid oxidase-like deaminating enzyme